MSPRDNMPDPRNQPDGSRDQDKHGRKQNSGSNQETRRGLGSARDPASEDLREEQARRERGPRSD
jgi:hypothetical protein